MAMKIVVVVMTVAVLAQGIASTRRVCINRSVRREYFEISREAQCAAPQQVFIPMPVPKGYDYVHPKVAKVKQCSELPCPTFPEKCLPRNVISRTIKVEAYRGGSKDCVTVTVDEHVDCECGCNELRCREDMVFNEATCSCECDPRMKLACDNRREINLEGVMWSQEGDRCACVCDPEHTLDCGDPNQSVFDPAVCRCIDIYS